MHRIAKVVAAALAMGLVAIGAGCQSSPGSSHASDVIHCSHCKVTEVRSGYTVPSYEGAREVGYLSTQDLECPGCRKAAAEFQTTGKLQPVCEVCGGSRTGIAAAR